MNLKEFVLHETVCPVPWSGMYLDPAGNVRNCSVSQKTLGNINDKDSIIDILNSQKNVEIKKDLLNKVKNPSCNYCWVTESMNTSVLSTSNRSHFKKTIGKIIPLTVFDSANNFDLKQVDLRWRNTCNLACVYCDSSLSSTWAKELNVEVSTNEAEIERTKQYIFEKIASLRYIYLCGGEPLLMKENADLIKLVQEKNPDIYIRVNTNLTNINSPIYKLLLNCKNVHWIISVDSIKENFEYIRYGAKWDNWFANLIQLKNEVQPNGHKITFNMVWCSLTSLAIFEAVDLFLSLGFSPNSFIIQLLDTPEYLRVHYINQKSKDLIKTMLDSRIPNTADSWLKTGYKLMQTELDNNYDINNNSSLLNFIHELDNRRNLNGKSLFANLL
jgi:MoaA/NifB/PqqE/SkfB family radical SAM enzyme